MCKFELNSTELKADLQFTIGEVSLAKVKDQMREIESKIIMQFVDLFIQQFGEGKMAPWFTFVEKNYKRIDHESKIHLKELLKKIVGIHMVNLNKAFKQKWLSFNLLDSAKDQAESFKENLVKQIAGNNAQVAADLHKNNFKNDKLVDSEELFYMKKVNKLRNIFSGLSKTLEQAVQVPLKDFSKNLQITVFNRVLRIVQKFYVKSKINKELGILSKDGILDLSLIFNMFVVTGRIKPKVFDFNRMLFCLTWLAPWLSTLDSTRQRTFLRILRAARTSKSASSAPLSAWLAGLYAICLMFAASVAVADLS